jgi:hypothetical protein
MVSAGQSLRTAVISVLIVDCLALKATLIGGDAKTATGKRSEVDRSWIDEPKGGDAHWNIARMIDFLDDLQVAGRQVDDRLIAELTAMTSTNTSRVVTWRM